MQIVPVLGLAWAATLALAFAAPIAKASESAPAAGDAAPLPTPTIPFDRADLDTTCSPCGDFYRFANGGWMDANPVPEDRSSWTAYAEVEERTRSQLRELLDEMARTWRDAADGSGERKLGAFFACCMDSERVEREGAAPLEPMLARIDAIRDRASLSEALGFLHAIGVGIPFSLSASPDPDDAEQTIASLSQAGVTLPVPSWYLEEGDDYVELRTAYGALVENAFKLLGRGEEAARSEAARVLELETALAGAMMSRADARDPALTTHRRTRREVRGLVPSLDWDAYFGELGVPEPSEYNVAQPAFLEEVERRLAGEPIATWRSYLSWWLARRASRFLNAELAVLHHGLRELWSGVVSPPPRRRLCEDMADFALGRVLGRTWAERSFPPAVKREAEEMAANLIAVYRERIEALDWMESSTRQEALAKLAALDVRIGYPDTPPDHSGLALDPEASFLDQVATVSAYRVRRDLARIGRPLDAEWGLLPQDVNAGYLPQRNAIEFPAAKFQPPFFDPRQNPEMNYGSIGATMAHEITHALDDEGRQYDHRGNLRDWWAPGDERRFVNQTARLVEQFDAYEVLDGVPLSGRLTLGENIADLGGVTIAYQAWRRSLRGKAPDRDGGFTAEQQFFLAWARNFRQTIRPERLRADVERDVHAPTYWRINGSLSNLEEFREAFGCRDGDPMVRPDSTRVRIW